MPKVSSASEYHCHAMLIAGIDNFLVHSGPAGLNNRDNSGLCCFIHSVSEWEKRIAGNDTADAAVS